MKYLFTEWTAVIRRYLRSREQERRAARLYGDEKFAEAAACYQSALNYAGERPLTLINYGLALYKDHRKQEARAAWERALEMTAGRNAYLAEQIEILLRQFG
jgi:tetratricopeptide (TPR) repeat protein